MGQIPLGIEFGIISLQSEAVTTAIDGFLVSLIEAVVIVMAVLLLFMGLRSGLIIGFILALTIAAPSSSWARGTWRWSASRWAR